ncbi:MAG TPA: DUF3501 family protein [Rhodospirillales bacterium]|jgi:hypothetical protein|nr:DUF3501 family protein [Rhodospirillales bacterium]
MNAKTELTVKDILGVESYMKVRQERRVKILNKKKLRRAAVGPYATFYFESYDTMWYQVQEMLRIEKGGEDQLRDELEAYNPLIPKGRELVATVMFEIDNANIRTAFLLGLGGVENHIIMRLDDVHIMAIAEQDLDRTNADGKASSVQFVHFSLTNSQIAKFKDINTNVTVGINHPKYGHMAVLSDETQRELSTDFL